MTKIYTALTALIVCILAAIPAAVIAAGDAKTVTINASEETGTLYRNGSAAPTSFCGEWKSTQTNPQFAITCGSKKNNMKYINGHIVAYTGDNNEGKTYTVTAGTTHDVTHIKLVVKDYDSNGGITITMGEKTITPSAEEQTLEADFAAGTPASFKVDGINKGAELLTCEITATEKAAPAGATTLAIERSECQTNGLNANGSFCASFVSNTNPAVTLASNGKANGGTSNNGYFDLRSGGTSLVWTISVPAGYTITGVSFDYANNGGASYLVCNGTTYVGADEAQKVELTELNTQSVPLRVNESNKGVRISNLKVTVQPGQATGSMAEPGQPDTSGDPNATTTPEIPAELIVSGDPVAFQTSSAPAGGQFAADTKWYIMSLNGLTVPYAEGSDRITLGSGLEWTDAQLYCITGNATDGYTIYNKAAGTGMQLASPKQLTGNGKDTYTILKAPGDANYSYLWDLTSSDKISGKTGYFIAQHGQPANAMNNNANQKILSFWNAGKDAGSTFLFYDHDNAPIKAEYLHGPYIFPNIRQTPYNVEYRIPAIGVVGGGSHAGRLVAFIDYRKNGGDISASSDTDLHFSYSDDGGTTWKHPDWMRDANGTPVSWAKHGERLKDPTSIRDHSFSDPACVADRESGEILVVSCAGCPASGFGFWGSRYPGKNRQEIARWFSHDGGDTWTETDYDMTERVYGELLAGAYDGQGIDGMFIGSGKIHQSRHVKIGKYYRLYAALSTQINGGHPTKNYVIYSDDFGRTWDLLGHNANDPACASNADEPKVEELPDGSVALIARGNGGNRNYNIFTFTDREAGYGSWGTVSNQNILGQWINACNGEPLMVPAIEKATGEKCYVLLQSIPFSGSREKVSIAYKKMGAPEEWNTPAKLGANWEGRYQVSAIASVYSTMAQMKDGNIAFHFEESPWGATCGVFYKFSLAQITDGAYEYTPDPDGAISKALTGDYDALYESRKADLEAILASDSKYVGQLSPAFAATIKPLITDYLASHSLQTLREIDAMLNGTREIIGIADGATYQLTNLGRTPVKYLTVNAENKLVATATKSDDCNFIFVAADPASRGAADLGSFYIQHAKTGRYAAATAANETLIDMVESIEDAAVYRYETTALGSSALICTTPKGGNVALHLAGDGSRIVPWTIPADASRWNIAPENVDDAIVTGIGAITTDPAQTLGEETIFDIYGRRIAADALRPGQLYISSKGRKFIAR